MQKKYRSLRDFYFKYGLDYVRSRDAKDAYTKTALYELRPFLSYTGWTPEVDPRGEYSDKLSNYWYITGKGLMKLQELFPDDEELNGMIECDLALIAKKSLLS